MPVSFLIRDGVKIAPFKDPAIKPFGAFANTTPVGSNGLSYPIKQLVCLHGQSEVFNWPSSEHAYHAQKIIFLQNKLSSTHPAQQSLCNMLFAIRDIKTEFNPRAHYDKLVNSMLPELSSYGLKLDNKRAFDKLCEADYHLTENSSGHKRSIDFMRKVVQLKLEQYTHLRLLAMECAQEGVIPVEVSRYDVNWASGPNGEGANLLGILLYQEGVRLLKAQGGNPAFEDPIAQYAKLGCEARKHDALEDYLIPDSSKGWVSSTRGLVLTQGQPLRDYFVSRNGNQRLVIEKHKIAGYEYRNDSHSPWQTSHDPSRYTGLITVFQQQNSKYEYFVSRNGNQRLVINNHKIINYEYRSNPQSLWQVSGDPSRYAALVSAFHQSQLDTHTAVDQPSNFLPEEISKITLLIGKLKKESSSCWPYPNKDRKKEKFKGLEALLEYAKKMCIEKAIEKVEKAFPEIREGNISKRTANLLDELRNKVPPMPSNSF